jgi:predicted aspartyl protease
VLPFSDRREVLLQTANGVLTGRQSQAETVQLAGATAKNVYAVVLPEGQRLGPEIDGLLGLSFLANFDMRISGNRLTLAPPEAGG